MHKYVVYSIKNEISMLLGQFHPEKRADAGSLSREQL
jgi:hypothetical protein